MVRYLKVESIDFLLLSFFNSSFSRLLTVYIVEINSGRFRNFYFSSEEMDSFNFPLNCFGHSSIKNASILLVGLYWCNRMQKSKQRFEVDSSKIGKS